MTKANRYITLFLFLTLTCMPLQGLFNAKSAAFAIASQSFTTTTATGPYHETKDKYIVTEKEKKKYKLIQVQVIHRHGDRSPITPMKDEKYWSGTLPPPTLLSKIAEGTTIKRSENAKENKHAAGGRGPFGKLTQLGLLQMVEVGTRIREEIHLEKENEEKLHFVDEEGHIHLQRGRLFTQKYPLHPKRIRVQSTDFPRTLQSVQALLVGLFPDGLPEGSEVEIDARHTDLMIPDPQPRTSKEQARLERVLSQRQHLLDREAELKGLAEKVSQVLKPFVGKDANSVNFGIGEEGDLKKKERALSWSQLSEIMTCLKVRGMLPESISTEEYETATSHSAWKWFENLRHSKLAFLAMKPFMDFIMNTLHNGCDRSKSVLGNDDTTLLHIYSGHDSSLIGLMCAFRLQQPSEWPEYGSYLKVELFEAEPINTQTTEEVVANEKEYLVRFSLNGNVLKSDWGLGEDEYLEAKDMIPLQHLDASIKREHDEYK